MEKHLTPYDAELCVMIKSLTGDDIQPMLGENRITFYIHYNKHNDPDYVNAVVNVVLGRLGERFIEMKDDPEQMLIRVRAEYSKDEYPDVSGFTDIAPGDDSRGGLYCHSLEEIRAIQVRRDNGIFVSMFCGNGVLKTERHPGGKCWFSFVNNGTFVDVPENDYIVRRAGATHCEIWTKEKFEKEWEPK